MKKIINGRMYNTETAQEISGYSYGCVGNFGYYEETLYRKKTGEFFLCGEGGPASKYREACSTGGWYGGSGIIPLTEDEAKSWAEDHLSVEGYISVFGEPEE